MVRAFSFNLVCLLFIYCGFWFRVSMGFLGADVRVSSSVSLMLCLWLFCLSVCLFCSVLVCFYFIFILFRCMFVF